MEGKVEGGRRARAARAEGRRPGGVRPPTRLEKISMGGGLAIERRRKDIDGRGKGCDAGAGWDLQRDLCETTRDRRVLDTKVLHRLCWKDCRTNKHTT